MQQLAMPTSRGYSKHSRPTPHRVGMPACNLASYLIMSEQKRVCRHDMGRPIMILGPPARKCEHALLHPPDCACRSPSPRVST